MYTTEELKRMSNAELIDRLLAEASMMGRAPEPAVDPLAATVDRDFLDLRAELLYRMSAAPAAALPDNQLSLSFDN